MTTADDRAQAAPRSLRALTALGVVAVAAMAFAPQLGRLDPRSGYTDAMAPGTDGTVHYDSSESSRRVDVQLLALDRPAAAPGGVRAAQGRELVAVRLRLASGRGSDIAGCSVDLRAPGGGAVPAETLDVAGSGCGTGAIGDAPREQQSTVYLSVPAGAEIARVRVRWDPPAYADLAAL